MQQLQAPSHWHCVDFVSDLHLQIGMPETLAQWHQYLRGTPAQAVFVLGDLFEVWIGDDLLDIQDSFERTCCQSLANAARRIQIFVMRGNRDFLLSDQFATASHCELVDDPVTLELGGSRWLLTHGDSLCRDDPDYLEYRKVVRSSTWRAQFLSLPLADRIERARAMRQQSQAHQRQAPVSYSAIHQDDAVRFLEQHGAQRLLHGHTHRPGRHTLAPHCERLVLSDWDLDADPKRAQVLRVRVHQQSPTKPPSATIERIPVIMATAE